MQTEVFCSACALQPTDTLKPTSKPIVMEIRLCFENRNNVSCRIKNFLLLLFKAMTDLTS